MNERAYTLRRDVDVPMRDGVNLCTDIWLPEGDGPFPVLLQRMPYDKSSSFMAQHIIGLEIVRALDAGFAVVVQDTRGRYASEGVFIPFAYEADDGRDTIAWLLEQDFCDGGVFMYGASYIGATQLLAASVAPKGLRAIAPQLTASDYYESWTYRGGALQLGFVLLWIIESLAPPDLDRRGSAEASRELLAELGKDPWSMMDRLPLRRPDLQALAPYVRDWLDHPARDEFWDAIDPSRAYGRMDVAALHIGGWNDIFLEGTLRNFERLGAEAATDDARRRQYLVVGPWSHGNVSAWQGDGWHGYGAEADLTAMHLEFFSALAEGREPNLPKARIFFTGPDTWHDLPSWPPPATTPTSWTLDAGGRLTRDGTGDPATLTYRSDPANPVPTAGGATFLPGLLVARNSGPRDQSEIEARQDVLVLTSAPLESDLTIAGEVRLHLEAASSAEDCDWTARLTEVDADGRSTGLVDGIVRARYRHGGDPAPLQPGRRESYMLPLGSLAHVVPAGHRLRLQIASSNHPRFDRNPQTMVEPVDATPDDFVVAEQTVFVGDGGTRLLIPVAPNLTTGRRL
ncbi:CocE/NonD family hydrolase [Actinomadura nitritigenes]|uniref:CocE/NonD family hydrolase n=1 Tax=Actinomadura nitritigenes TaxID=134602 RepID=A0ABS3RBA0_9ACTN|nr:CocE/NonD family hydrolase [Actinomadura nitritigenes]MBO2443508.1 CocE/NonD family hydrolase [Actinomadura nitritigenes]